MVPGRNIHRVPSGALSIAWRSSTKRRSDSGGATMANPDELVLEPGRLNLCLGNARAQ